MKLAIMQPYIFPYIGYFQLINSADKFVIYDDVGFIKQGWINRNKILLNGKEFLFTIPIKNASSFTIIGQTGINHQLYGQWKAKFFKTLTLAYARAPYYPGTFDLVTSIFNEKHDTISELATSSLVNTSKYIGINTAFNLTAANYNNTGLKAQERIIDICKKENADIYNNPIGGKELYSKDDFKYNNIILNFIKSRNIAYPQFNISFVPWLSIIDVMMFNKPMDIKFILGEYDLI